MELKNQTKPNKRINSLFPFFYNTKVDGQRNTCCCSCSCCCFFHAEEERGSVCFCAGAVCVEGRRRTSRLRVLMSRRGRMEIVMDGPFFFLFLAL